MTIFLRDQKNNTILDVDIWVDDYSHVEVSSVVIIKEYSNFLLNLPKEKQKKAIDDFDNLSELKGWLWEVYFTTGKNTPEHIDNVKKEIKKKIKKVSEKYNLLLIED